MGHGWTRALSCHHQCLLQRSSRNFIWCVYILYNIDSVQFYMSSLYKQKYIFHPLFYYYYYYSTQYMMLPESKRLKGQSPRVLQFLISLCMYVMYCISLNMWLTEVEQYSTRGGKDIVKILVGNKIDQKRAVTRAQVIYRYAIQQNIVFISYYFICYLHYSQT